MTAGVLFALVAGLMWGLVFVAPLLLPDYPAALLSVGRYTAFGLIALPLAWLDRARLRELTRADWREALKLAAIGNLLYYLLLAAAIQRAGGPLPTMVIGTLPVVIAIASNWRDGRRDGRLPWLRLAPSLFLIAAGVALVNRAELTSLHASGDVDPVVTPPARSLPWEPSPAGRGIRFGTPTGCVRMRRGALAPGPRHRVSRRCPSRWPASRCSRSRAPQPAPHSRCRSGPHRSAS